MEREMRVPRVLFPVLLMIALALIVNGVEAQERGAIVRSTAPNYVTLRSTSSGAYLGVVIREVTEEDVTRLNLSEERGALVTEVPEDGPAAGAGLKADDVITSWNGSRIESAAQLTRVVRETPAGRSVELRYIRERRERTAKLELGDRPSGFARVFPDNDDVRLNLEESLAPLARMRFGPNDDNTFSSVFLRGGRLGAGVQSLGDQLAAYFGASDGGVLVASVSEDSPAAAGGLRAGDVILSVDGDKVSNPGDLMEEIWEADEGEVELRVLRDRQQRTLKVTLPERPEGLGSSSGNTFYFGPQGRAMVPDVEWSDDFGRVVIPDVPAFRFESPVRDFELHVPSPPAPAEPEVRT